MGIGTRLTKGSEGDTITCGCQRLEPHWLDEDLVLNQSIVDVVYLMDHHWEGDL